MSKSLIEKFRKFLSREARERVAKREKLHKILKQMRKRQKELELELAACRDDETSRTLRKKIRILQEQRRKGTELLAELRRLARRAETAGHQSR